MIPIDQVIRITGIVLKECRSRGICVSESFEYADSFIDSIKGWITEDDAHYWDDYTDKHILNEFIEMHFPELTGSEKEDYNYSEPTDPREYYEG